MAFDKDAIIASLKEASILDLADLVKAIEEEFGVSAAAPAAAAAAGEDAAVKDSFDVELTEPGQAKIGVIKAVRDATGLGLKESKDLVDGAPSVIKSALSESDANDLKAKLEAAGATVTLK
ncbi:50S ribosomal protein L7/L12 [Oenococcus sicerae]|uniref:Large ribosomal subunit protein bL12 n=1 Tax=Oenococcus sicerae TaxID=2203724 RepID=A0AAJ1RAI2_9LACO|nr:50S ribosomal protein L7/L12 [Oenococcus sicerae]MDN6900752.1 50S ribosomal protein L7/L12 [Oenococcus sicerae]QAS69249.1 50S ribosomal protein L7/L12 [Oenococcus sicerae]VDK14657.1 50S ribosomal protein L7/L12 {ECO:0000255/HAMAP-Rule:MF_00368} [Oenococcus sicerae]